MTMEAERAYQLIKHLRAVAEGRAVGNGPFTEDEIAKGRAVISDESWARWSGKPRTKNTHATDNDPRFAHGPH